MRPRDGDQKLKIQQLFDHTFSTQIARSGQFDTFRGILKYLNISDLSFTNSVLVSETIYTWVPGRTIRQRGVGGVLNQMLASSGMRNPQHYSHKIMITFRH